MKKLFALGIMIIMFTAVGFSQSSATASAAATIFTPISITKAPGGDLNFGIMASSGTAGTCVLPPAGLRTVTGGVTLMGGAPQPATFTVTGITDANYSITLPSSATTVSDGTNTMTINTWTSDHTGQITGGSITLHVGATLNVGALQPAGVYNTSNALGSGDFTITVNYN